MAKKTDQTQNYLGLRTSVMAVASCLALCGIPLAAQAAGLGKVVVHSALGQPLRAEIEVSATRDELADMKAQLASPDAFKQAGLDYATTLLGIRFAIDKRANGQSLIRLTSDKPINDPFIDMLLELSWPTGRLVREYTFLLDPPEVAGKASAPVTPAMARQPAAARTPAGSAPSAAIDDELRSKAVARVRSQDAVAQPPVPKPAEPAAGTEGEGRAVKRGDTLAKIANETRPEGVTLDQMLVGLLRANQDAFDGGNMNRLKAGRILTLPDRSALEAVPASEARRIVVAQSSDWNAYRNKLAGIAAQTPVRDATIKQESAGKITAKVDDKAQPATAAKDQLKVSTSEKATSKSGAAEKRSEEDQIAKEKALDEARQRMLALEKNVADLQKLVDLKNQNLAELQKQATTKAAVEPAAAPVVVPAAPAPTPEPAAAVIEKPAEKPAEPVAQREEAKPEIKPEPKPVAPKPKVVAPPPEDEPTLLDQMLDNPLALAGGGGVLALLAALFLVRRRRASQGEAPLSLGSSLSQQFSSLTANSIFRSTGGQSVDTSHGPAQTDFSQAGPGSIDTDEVDPVAEADVYMAYGRDAQAEEILIEARQKDPKRHAIYLKLLEIYANRKDAKQFEALATELYSETAGVGADWEKAAAMGLRLDPDNPLYNTVEPSATMAPALAGAAPMPLAATPEYNQTVSLPGELSQMAELASVAHAPAEEPARGAPESAVPAQEPAIPAADLAGLDFDLGLGDEPGLAAAESEPINVGEAEPEALDAAVLDFDLAAVSSVPATDQGLDFDLPETPALAAVVAAADEQSPGEEGLGPDDLAGLDFDLGVEPVADEGAALRSSAEPSSSGEGRLAAEDGADVKFDVDLTESTFLGQTIPETSSFDMSAIDLDLDAPEAASLAGTGPAMAHDYESVQAATVVNSGFDAAQAETLISPQQIDEGGFAEEEDFSVVQSETNVNPQLGDELEPPPAADMVSSEDVTTKLDLAKAYEEMGDLEGARELLQEVLLEGDAAQRAKAQFILAKIGE